MLIEELKKIRNKAHEDAIKSYIAYTDAERKKVGTERAEGLKYGRKLFAKTAILLKEAAKNIWQNSLEVYLGNSNRLDFARAVEEVLRELLVKDGFTDLNIRTELNRVSTIPATEESMLYYAFDSYYLTIKW